VRYDIYMYGIRRQRDNPLLPNVIYICRKIKGPMLVIMVYFVSRAEGMNSTRTG
jgi:hypothetical protein